MSAARQAARLGVIGGLGALGSVDVLAKVVQALPARSAQTQADVLFEQGAFREDDCPGAAEATHNGRKLYVFDMARAFEARQVDAVLLPCFLSQTFWGELQAEVRVPIVDLMAALREEIEQRHPQARRLGVLTSDYVRAHGLFERHFSATRWQLLHPDTPERQAEVMQAIYAEDGLKSGHLQGRSVERLVKACEQLLARGAELIVPGFAEIPVVIDVLRSQGLPVLDVNQIYARYAVRRHARSPTPPARPVRIGVVGGVGPAATVDFLDKIVRHTPAGCDQDHLKLVVEQNPQIPDRTGHLLAGGPDPTIALYATCKRLEAADADLIAIPCNTAHAFVERIQPYLSVPVVNMLDVTVNHVQTQLPPGEPVGLLATSGTVRSGLYERAAARVGRTLLIPDEAHQAQVMAAIYGEQGVKAGFTQGACREALLAALAHLVQRGVRAVILGCTELPLVLPAHPAFEIAGTRVMLLDPTELLARRCVGLAMEGHPAAA